MKNGHGASTRHPLDSHQEQAPTISFGNLELSADSPALMVAEIGLNHCGSVERARQLIRAAADCGANAVKFQKRSPRALLTKQAYEQPYDNGGNSFGPTYGSHREALEFDLDTYRELQALAHKLDMELFASVWDVPSLEEMNHLGVPAFKIGSADLTNDTLIKLAATFDKPVFISTGMSSIGEIDHAVSLLKSLGTPFVIFHCVSMYPTPIEHAQLSTISKFISRYGIPVGYSGHEREAVAAVAARTLGACVIEKHFTLNNEWKGGDQKMSLLPEDFASLVEQVRAVEKGLLGARENILEGEKPQRRKLAKSIVAACAIQKGQTITREMLDFKCPGSGLSAHHLERVIGSQATRDIKEEELIDENSFESSRINGGQTSTSFKDRAVPS